MARGEPSAYIDLEDDDDGLIEVGWAFGPQGHPASMRITVYLSEEDNMVPSLSILGPRISGSLDKTSHWIKGFKTMKELRVCLEYGKLIEEKFGQSWWWHMCVEACKVKTSTGSCENCKDTRVRAIKETEEWYKENPFPNF